jgi:tRNA pseudouridine55 synthase
MPDDRQPNGWLVLDKPSGLTSNQVVGRVRRALGVKAGHAGTLDPLATGVLPIALGEATKTIAFVIKGPKRYRFRIRWGIARTTDDSEGEIIAVSGVLPEKAAVEAVLPRFCGTILQRPPAYSALKISGRRFYALARAGRAPPLNPRPIEIFSIKMIAMPASDHADFEAVVGKGTYIRALARDLAASLGTLGHVACLRRLAVGPFTEAHAISLESVGNLQHIAGDSRVLLPIGTALAGVPTVAVAGAEADRLRHGQRVALREPRPAERSGWPDAGTVVSAWHDNDLVALAMVEGNSLRPLRVINS